MDQYRSRNQYPLTYGALMLSSLLGIAVFVFFGWLSKLVDRALARADPQERPRFASPASTRSTPSVNS